ncbi:MAG: hypothetical protein WCX97_01370 [Candidatus Magasanikbacteria bacterium]
MQYFIGIIAILIGVSLIIKTEWYVANFGASAWAEDKFGTTGGTRIMYKLIGLVFIFVGFLAVTNMWTSFLMATVGKIFIR